MRDFPAETENPLKINGKNPPILVKGNPRIILLVRLSLQSSAKLRTPPGNLTRFLSST
jgi:hypothetical protein